MNIAIVSPSLNAYSESFIQAHKGLEGKVFFYYGGNLPHSLEGHGRIRRAGFFVRSFRKIERLTGSHAGIGNNVLDVLQSLKENRIDVVLAEYGPTGVAMLPVCELGRIPLVVHFHGFDASRYAVLEQYREGYRRMFNYATAVVAVSKKMVADLGSLGCAEQKIHLNTYGPNDAFFNVALSGKRKYFLAMGRFVNKKAPYLTIASFKQVVARHPSAKLVMAGDGELLQVCKHLVELFGLQGNVEFVGVKGQEEVCGLMAGALAFVQHSVTADDGDSEGTPVAILEASAAGLPVVATRHAGIPDVVIDGQSGMLVEEGDVDGMAKAMVQLLDNEELATEMGRNGKDRVASHFRQRDHLQSLNALLRSAIAHQNRTH